MCRVHARACNLTYLMQLPQHILFPVSAQHTLKRGAGSAFAGLGRTSTGTGTGTGMGMGMGERISG